MDPVGPNSSYIRILMILRSKLYLNQFLSCCLLLAGWFTICNMMNSGNKTFADAVRCNALIRPNTIKCLGLEFKHRRIEGDGNCLYHAIAFWVYDNENLHDRVRNEIVTYAKSRWAELGAMALLCYPQCKTVHDCTKFMSKDKEYGGQYEVVMASKLYMRPIYTYNKFSKSFIVDCPVYADHRAPILLWYDFVGAHYEVILEKNERHYEVVNRHPTEPNVTQDPNDVSLNNANCGDNASPDPNPKPKSTPSPNPNPNPTPNPK